MTRRAHDKADYRCGGIFVYHSNHEESLMPASRSTFGFALAVTGSLMLTATAGTAFARGPIPHPPPICDASCQANKARPIPRPTATNAGNNAITGGVQHPDSNRRLN